MKATNPLLLFDVDGVLLKEDGYYRTLAVTCAYFYEKICQEKGVAPVPDRLPRVCSLHEVDRLKAQFLPSNLLELLRKKALNSNWDKTFAIVLATLQLPVTVLDDKEFGQSLFALLSATSGMGGEYLASLESASGPTSPTFAEVKKVFQQYHLQPWPNTEFFKAGMIAYDETIVPHELLQVMLKSLKAKGLRLGIGTGRPAAEVRMPLVKFALYELFEEDRVLTIDHVRKQEQSLNLPAYSLAKPHPYTYLEGARGYEPDQVFVIGDSTSDQIAANKAGFRFVGVGEKSSFLDEFGPPELVIDNVLALPEYFNRKL